MHPGKIRIVLHRPQSAENLGAAARVMKNFGLSRLAVVAPPAWSGLPRHPRTAAPAPGGAVPGVGPAGQDVLARARRMARKASDLLDGIEVFADLRAALGPATWTCGTTSRAVEGRPWLTPRALAAELVRRATAGGEVAVVFGEERRGLSDAELELCQAVCTIPTSPAYDSMNLAQAVAVISYEIAAASPVAAPAPAGPSGDAVPARHATVEALWERARAVLAAAGYLNPQNPEHILADFRRLLARAEPVQREVELLIAALRAVERRLGLPGARGGGDA